MPAAALGLAVVWGTATAQVPVGGVASPLPAAPPSGPGAPSTPPAGQPSSPSTPPAFQAQALVPDKTRVGIVPGSTVQIGVSGGSGSVFARSSAPGIVDLRYDPLARRVELMGRAPGTASVNLVDDAGDSARIDVLVAAPAGVVPSDVTVELGGLVTPQFAAAQIQAAIAASAQLRPGATVAVSDATPGGVLRPGDALELTGRVHVDGANAFVDVDGATNVHLKVDTLAELDPQILFYSDDPEKLQEQTNGTLFSGTLRFGRPARVYFYHVAADSTHDLYLTLRATGGDARVQVLGYAGGPADAYAYVGHVATVRYLLARASQQSDIVDVGEDGPYAIPLGSGSLRPRELVAGAFDLSLLSGDPVEVQIVSTKPGGDPVQALQQSELPGDGHGRRGEFDLDGVPPLALSYEVGGSDSAPFEVGLANIPNLRGGRPLAGDYGVVRSVALRLTNPGPDPATVYLYEVPVGGPITSTIWFDGDPGPTELPCIYRPGRYAVRAFSLAPNTTQNVSGEYMTDGASALPLDFGLTATPPTPQPGPYSPDACNPHTPPPPTPAPAAPAAPAASAMPTANSPLPAASQTPQPAAAPTGTVGSKNMSP